MPRPRRLFPPDSVLHVVNRGNERRRLFADAADYLTFMALLRRAQARHDMRVLAYVVMPNHWHVVVWPSSAEGLWRFMHGLTSTHAARFRQLTGTYGLGHVYQARYFSALIATDARYVNAIRYIEANPVRANLVSRAEQWPWSSVRERLGSHDLIVDGPVSLPNPEEWLALVNQRPGKLGSTDEISPVELATVS